MEQLIFPRTLVTGSAAYSTRGLSHLQSNGLVESVLFVTAEDNMLLANHTYPVSIKGESSELVGWAEAELTIVPPPSALKITNAFSPLQVNPGQEFYVSVTVSYSFESDTSLRIEIVNSTTKTALASPKEDTVSGADYNVYDFNLTSPESRNLRSNSLCIVLQRWHLDQGYDRK